MLNHDADLSRWVALVKSEYRDMDSSSRFKDQPFRIAATRSFDPEPQRETDLMA